MIDRIKIIRDGRDGRYTWKALDKTGRKIGQGHRKFTRLSNALRNIESITGCSTEIMPRKTGRHRVACWRRTFEIEVED